MCLDDAGSHYEPYGEFKINVGHKDTHTVWKEDGSTEVKNGEEYILNYSFTSKQDSEFERIGELVFIGKVKEDDTFSGDDLIGNYNGYVVPASDIAGYIKTYEFSGEDGNWVKIDIRLDKA